MGDENRLEQLAIEGKKRLAQLEKKNRAKKKVTDREPTASERAAIVIYNEDGATQAMQMVLVFVPTVVGTLIGVFASPVIGFLIAVIGTAVGLLVITLARRVGARTAVDKERAWLATLPFEVRGWFTLVEKQPESGRIKAVLEFIGERPEHTQLEHLIEGSLSAQGAFISPEVEQSYGIDDAVPSNAAYLRWQRKLVTSVLLSLHQRSPIRRVSFEKAS